MSDESLRALVANLRSELARAHDLDAGAREVLHGLVREVEAALHTSTAGVSGESPLRDRLSDWVRELEVSHPRVSGAVGRIVDTLAFYNL
jgi:hypothetical protein